jgi:hypothetical protein
MRLHPETAPGHDDQDVHSRIHAEFSEMPGLQLTLPQAARLFNLDPAQCERALGSLVDRGALCRLGGTFKRPGMGRQFA